MPLALHSKTRGAKLAAARQAKKFTQQRVAKALGVDRATVAGWELGEPFRAEYLQPLFDLLHVQFIDAVGRPAVPATLNRYEYALQITDQVEAGLYLQFLVGVSIASGLTPREADHLERENLAYCAAYYDDETRERVERLYRCKHPVFGAIADTRPPDDAFEAGLRKGQARRLAALNS